MTTFDSAKHPRSSDGSGRFAEHHKADPGQVLASFQGRRTHPWELGEVDHSGFPTGHLPELPDWASAEYVLHSRLYSGALAEKIGGVFADTGGGCTAVEKTLSGGATLIIASEGELPSGVDVSMGVVNSDWENYAEANTDLSGRLLSVDELAAEVEALIGRYNAEHARWTLE